MEVTTGHTDGGEFGCHHSVGVAILGQRAKPRQNICLFIFSHPLPTKAATAFLLVAPALTIEKKKMAQDIAS